MYVQKSHSKIYAKVMSKNYFQKLGPKVTCPKVMSKKYVEKWRLKVTSKSGVHKWRLNVTFKGDVQRWHSMVKSKTYVNDLCPKSDVQKCC